MNTLGTYEFDVRSYECGPDGFVTLASVMNYLQESASLQAEASGFSKCDFELSGENISWVLTRFHLKMDRYPRWREQVRIVTWPCGGRRITAERDFELYLGDEKVGVATSEWMLIDLATRKIVPIPASVFAKTNDERPRALGAGHSFAKLRWDCRAIAPDAVRFRAKRGDIDLNGHVNNVHYVEWLVETLPPEAGSVVDFEIAFKTETLAGDEVVAESVAVEPNVYSAHVCSSDARDHAVARLAIGPVGLQAQVCVRRGGGPGTGAPNL